MLLFFLEQGLLLLFLFSFFFKLFHGLVDVGAAGEHLREGEHVIGGCLGNVVGSDQAELVELIISLRIRLRFDNWFLRSCLILRLFLVFNFFLDFFI